MPKTATKRISDKALEYLRARNEARNNLLRYAHDLPGDYGGAQFRNLDVDERNEAVVRAAKKYARELFRLNRRSYLKDEDWTGPNFILSGPSGTGKTSIAWAIMWEIWELNYFNEDMGQCIDDEFKVNFFKFVELEQALAGLRRGVLSDFLVSRRYPRAKGRAVDVSYDSNYQDIEDAVRYLVHLALLVLDEMALAKPSDETLKVLYQVIDARCAANRPTIVTMNVKMDDAIERGLIDPRLAFRLGQRAYKFHVVGKNRRLGNDDPWKEPWKPRLDLGFEEDPDPGRLVGRQIILAEVEEANRERLRRMEEELRAAVKDDGDEEPANRPGDSDDEEGD